MSKKQSVLLGLREKVESSHRNMLEDMISKFKSKQGLFQGLRKTYEALDGYADDTTKRAYNHVASTVGEQLEWFKEHTEDYLNIVFSIEKTNAGGPSASLVVDGTDWGVYTTLELLRLKSILDGKIKQMVHELPIRSETTVWTKTQDSTYAGRGGIWESPVDSGFLKTTIKDTVIVNDPHIKDAPNRPPVTRETSTQVNVGKYTSQEFSGMITNRERAETEVRLNTLYTAVIEALEKANDTESVPSDLGGKVLEFLF